ncbi:tubulin polyglutamylase TTLL13 [Drosophila willistoni]|uniref:tubulin polyglutamylase TTLL13 n=1 Tax=Drosophila willistoni TaxID=7260 RepID=UPI000C26C7A4|nr:tubulin polyglutamylase TTLL13 [Drosophila willistoni]
MPTRKNSKLEKFYNPYTRYFEAQKNLSVSDKRHKLGTVYRRESVYVLSGDKKKRRHKSNTVSPLRHIQLQSCEPPPKAVEGPKQPRWRPKAPKINRIMVITEDHTQDNNQLPGSPELDAICYDVMKEPPKQLHLEGTDIMPSIRAVRLSICVENTRFALVSRISKNMGFQHVPEHRLWNIQWSDSTPHHDLLKNMKRFQQINHFPGMMEICRKDLLSRNLNRMLKMYPGDYRIFPKTWLMPTDAYDVAIYASRHKRTYILKPYSSGQGRGIKVTTDLRTIGKREKLICQTYIEKPLLIDGYKFDLRVYTLITSVDPLRIFVYNEGLARFATHKYVPPTTGNSNNVFMHLTNYCLNRRNSQYDLGNGTECGSKRKLSAFNKWLVAHNYDKAEFWASVDDAIIKTVISAWPVLRHNYNACFPKHDKIQASFQLLGFDILVDWKLKPYILEVNHTPSLCADEPVDTEVKRPLIRDTLNLLATALVDKEQIIREDRITLRERLMKQVYNRKSANQAPQVPQREAGGTDAKQACSIGALAQQIAWEESHLGNYRRIMPPRESEKVNYYCKFYDQTKNIVMFAETASSKNRVRHTHMQIQKRRVEQKIKMEELQKQNHQNQRRQEIPRFNPVLAQEKLRCREEAQAARKRAIIAKDIQRHKEQLLIPNIAKEHIGIWQTVVPMKGSSKYKAGVSTKQKRRKHQTQLQQRHATSHRVRRQHMLDMEAQWDAQFVQRHGIKKPKTEDSRLEGGKSREPPTSPHLTKRSSKKINPSSPEINMKTEPNWSPDTISDSEEEKQKSWRKQRAKEVDSSNFREMLFSGMYKHGQLTKNDIKCFPNLLFRLLGNELPNTPNEKK